MRLLLAILACHLLGGCAVQVYMQKAQANCRVVYNVREGAKQVCEEGNYFRIKDIYFGDVKQYMAEQVQASADAPPASERRYPCEMREAETPARGSELATSGDRPSEQGEDSTMIRRIFER